MPRGIAEGGGGGTLFLPIMIRERLRLGESPFNLNERGARPDVGIEKNLICSLNGFGALNLQSPLFERDKGAGNTSSRPPCCVEFRYRNEGSSCSSRIGDEELCISACKSKTMRECAWHCTTNLCIFSPRATVPEEESVVRARVG